MSNLDFSYLQPHDWTKVSFSTPPYCYLCKRLICDLGKLGYYCNSCHLACHIECNSKEYHVLSFCMTVKHDWTKDQLDPVACGGCGNLICSPKLKASGYSCSKCSVRAHKNCRNLCTTKCETLSSSSKSSIFSTLTKKQISSTSLTNLTKDSSPSGKDKEREGANLSPVHATVGMLDDDSHSNSLPINFGHPNGGAGGDYAGNRLSKSTIWTAPSTPFNESGSNCNINSNSGGPTSSNSPSGSSTSVSSTSSSSSSTSSGTASSVLYSSNVNNRLSRSVHSGMVDRSSNSSDESVHLDAIDMLLDLDSLQVPTAPAQRLAFVERMRQFFFVMSLRMEDLHQSYEIEMSEYDESRPRFRSIAEILHHQMISSGRVRMTKQYQHYIALVENFLILYSRSWCEKTETIFRLAFDFYHYLCTHKQDPENILLGCTPSKDVQRRVKKYFYIHLDSSKEKEKGSTQKRFDWDFRMSKLSMIENLGTCSTIENKDILQKSVKEFSAHLEREKLAKGDLTIVKIPKHWNWTENETASCYVLNDPDHHEFDEGSFIFARFLREADSFGVNCLVYILPDEIKPVKLPFSRVCPLKTIDFNLPAVVSSTSIDKYERYITNPYDAFIVELRNFMKESTKMILTEQGLNVNLIAKGLNFDGVSSAPLEELVTVRNKINSIQSPDFLGHLDQMASDVSQYFTQYLKKVYMNELNRTYQLYSHCESNSINLSSSLVHEYNNLFHSNAKVIDEPNDNEQSKQQPTSPNSLKDKLLAVRKQYTKFKPFLPSINNLISEIEAGKKFTFKASDSLTSLKSESDLAIENIRTLNIRLLDGSKKKELTARYLQNVRTEIDSYLKNKGYDSTAISENYIDKPPASLSRVKENLRLVNLLMRPATTKDYEERLNTLIVPLRNKIYRELDEFLSAAEILLSALLREYHNHLFEISNGGIHYDTNSFQLTDDFLSSLSSMLRSIYNAPIASPGLNSSNTFTTNGSNITASQLSHLSPTMTSSMIIVSSSGQNSPNQCTFNLEKSTVVIKLFNIIEEILYIREMKVIEEKFYSNETLMEPNINAEKHQFSQIVPVTGLLFGRVLRLKQEIKTTLEVWSNKDVYNYSLLKPSITTNTNNNNTSNSSSNSSNNNNSNNNNPGYNYHGVIIGKKDEYIKEKENLN